VKFCVKVVYGIYPACPSSAYIGLEMAGSAGIFCDIGQFLVSDQRSIGRRGYPRARCRVFFDLSFHRFTKRQAKPGGRDVARHIEDESPSANQSAWQDRSPRMPEPRPWVPSPDFQRTAVPIPIGQSVERPTISAFPRCSRPALCSPPFTHMPPVSIHYRAPLPRVSGN
jgi:hypothetical protein